MRSLLLALPFLMAMALTADAQNRQERLLIGTWNCTLTTTAAGMPARIKTVSRFQKNGRTNEDFALSTRVDGTPTTLHGFNTGTWRIEGRRLIRQITSFNVTHGTLGSRPMPDELRKEVQPALANEARSENKFPARILRLTASELRYNQQGDRTRCTRASS